MPKKIKFMIEFEKPEKGEGMSVSCPECGVVPGDECQTRGLRRMSDLHHDRFAKFLNLEIIGRGTLYRIKP